MSSSTGHGVDQEKYSNLMGLFPLEFEHTTWLVNLESDSPITLCSLYAAQATRRIKNYDCRGSIIYWNSCSWFISPFIFPSLRHETTAFTWRLSENDNAWASVVQRKCEDNIGWKLEILNKEPLFWVGRFGNNLLCSTRTQFCIQLTWGTVNQGIANGSISEDQLSPYAVIFFFPYTTFLMALQAYCE